MKTPFLLSLLTASILLAGCAGSGLEKPAELTLEAPSQYDQRLQDGLGSQRYREANILYQRQMNELGDDIERLERQKKALEAGLNNAAYENGLDVRPASAAEADRISEYQDAARQSQAKIARSDAELTVQKALLENRRDADLLSVDRKVEAKVADIEREYAKLVNLAEQNTRDLISARNQQEQATAAIRSREAAALDSQRFTLAVANAEQIKEARADLTAAQTDLDTSQRQYESQIAALEAKLAALRTESAQTLALKNDRISKAESNLNRLVEVGEMLKAHQSQTVAATSSDFQLFVSEQERRLADHLAEIDRSKQLRIAEVRAQVAEEKTLISSRTRTEIAGLESVATIQKSTVIAPVVTGRKVYTGDSDKPSHASVRPADTAAKSFALASQSKPITVSTFKPVLEAKPEGNQDDMDVVVATGNSSNRAFAGAPVVQEAKTREVYDVVYVYTDELSWDRFKRYLEAYGITDITSTRNNKKGEWYIFAGRFYDDKTAAQRVDDLNRKTHTSHAKVIKKDIPL